MDRDQQELKSIGFWGILKKSFKIIYTERVIFTKLTLSSIFPLTIIFLGYPHFVVHIHIKSGLIVVLALAGIILAVIFFLLPTSAVVYTVARIYTAKKITFKTIFLSVVPKAWRRLMVTSAIQFLIMLAYNFVSTLLCISIVLLLTGWLATYTTIIFLILYSIGLLYISVIWNLANVVSLLEDLKGFGAIKKSKALLKGKRLVASSLFLLITIPVVVGQVTVFIYAYNGTHGDKTFDYVDICSLLTLVLILPVLILLAPVIQTIFYFVCKSYHHEIIDKFYLEIHLDNFVHAAASVPLVEMNVQLEHSNI